MCHVLHFLSICGETPSLPKLRCLQAPFPPHMLVLRPNLHRFEMRHLRGHAERRQVETTRRLKSHITSHCFARRFTVAPHTIFGGIADELAKEGVELIPATPWLAALMPGPGFRLGRKLSQAQRQDLAFGFRLAKEVSRLEIGQTVVVKDGTVLAVEGFEGTDRCLARGGELAGKDGDAIAIKVAKLNHDLRFDIPCLGPKTLETCVQAGITVLALEAGRTLLLEQEACAALAERHKITVTTVL